MKAKTAIVLIDGTRIKTALNLDQAIYYWAQMARAKEGSSFGLERITDHGTVKRTALLAGTILRIDEL